MKAVTKKNKVNVKVKPPAKGDKAKHIAIVGDPDKVSVKPVKKNAASLRRAEILSILHREGVQLTKAGMLTPYRKEAAREIAIFNKAGRGRTKEAKRANLKAFLNKALTTEGSIEVLKSASDRKRAMRVLTAVYNAVHRHEG